MALWLNSFTGAKKRSRKSSCVTAVKNAGYNVSSSGRIGRTKILAPSGSAKWRSQRFSLSTRSGDIFHRPEVQRLSAHAPTPENSGIGELRSKLLFNAIKTEW